MAKRNRKIKFTDKYPRLSESSDTSINKLKATIESLDRNIGEKSLQVTRLNEEIYYLKKKIKVQEIKETHEIEIIKQLHEYQQDLLFYKDKALVVEKKIEKHKGEIYYGARHRIERELPYRLGDIIIKNSSNPKNLAKLPLLIFKEHKLFSQETKNMNLPPLETYKDAAEAERIKQHLTYKVGSVIAETIEIPKNIFKLPFKIAKEIYFFKKEKP